MSEKYMHEGIDITEEVNLPQHIADAKKLNESDAFVNTAELIAKEVEEEAKKKAELDEAMKYIKQMGEEKAA